MPKWLVRLKGEKVDLDALREQLRSPENSVVEENGSFYLESSEFNSLTSEDEVCKRGRALINLIDAAAKFDRDTFLGVSENGIIRLEDDGKRHHYVFIEETFVGRDSVKVTVIDPDGYEKVVLPSASALESLLGVAQKHNVVADALNFYRDDTWISLYKAFEIIRDDVGDKHQIIKNGWSVDSCINRFTQTAQSRAALGDSARHASKKYKPPAQPMSLSEAEALINVCCKIKLPKVAS